MGDMLKIEDIRAPSNQGWQPMSMPDLRERCAPDPFADRWGNTFPSAGIYVRISGDRMTGPLYLYDDATDPLGAVTLRQLVELLADGGMFVDAPNDGQLYARIAGEWLPLLDGGTY